MGQLVSAPKHTPGPWTTNGAEVFGADGFAVCDPRQGPHLHANYDSDRGHWGSTPGASIERSEEEEEANARLIAAAPDLLSALRRLVKAQEPFREIKGRSLFDLSHAWQAERLAASECARAAIAKAEGK